MKNNLRSLSMVKDGEEEEEKWVKLNDADKNLNGQTEKKENLCQ
jgi:hypothetical protein